MHRGRSERALECFEQALKLQPENTMYLNNRGQLRVNVGDYEKAMVDFNRALSLNPQHAKAYRNRAGCHLAMNQPQKAIEDATKCIELTPEESRAWRTRAEAKMMLEMEAEAAQDMQQAIILGPQPPSGLAMWVPAKIKQRDDAALKAVIADASEENRRKLAEARHEHAFAILDNERREPKQHELEEAVALARSACVLDPDHAAHPFLAGLLYQELVKFDERALAMAETMFEQAVDLDEEHAAAWLELGLLMADQDRPMKAIAALEQALTHDPVATAEHAPGPLCAVYAANDEGLRGLDFFEEQYDANPEVPALAVGRALMLHCLGDRAAALRQMEDLVLIEPEGSAERDYAQKLIAEWKGTTP
jgi:tetratricopeptide (TPR) repeat protein